ncbi:HD-GYP domain-containing protein [Thermoanaerobacterium thermosaccharolyticum]|uniref:HD-GYP domain-containing protein n=1 Tax=Thermoanaerobacterium thermosaccharolyticum TaxID=1517 RepID=UPI002FD90274
MLSKKLIFYITFIVIIGISVIIYSIVNINIHYISDILILIIFSAICESLPIYINNNVSVSVAYAVDLMAILLYGPLEGAIIASIGNLLLIRNVNGKMKCALNTPYYKTLFNISQITISVFLGGFVYKYLGGVPGRYVYPKYLIPAIIASAVYYFSNSGIVAVLLSFLLKKPILSIWTSDFSWTLINFLFLAFIGILMASAFMAYGYIALFVFFIPLLMVRYMFKLYMDLKQSYYDTINALTKALEAKDRYTLGHSKSVEKLAVYLCREAGFSEAHTEMVRIAALLHDVGKIGIVENILNKPGKLSKEEYDYIKQHPVSGYEILKDVPFLKNVRYWVRYHHEWYNGNGYPDGISGRQIPLEAEILSVADVFDALVSDRPYRNAYTREEAYKIIVDSEGTQFSPRVIRLFKRAYEKNKEDFKHDF